jgi:hemolysin activation/secretion protein
MVEHDYFRNLFNFSFLILMTILTNSTLSAKAQISNENPSPNSPQTEQTNTTPNQNITVQEFRFESYTGKDNKLIFTDEELGKILIPEIGLPIANIKNTKLSLIQLNQIVTKVAEFYTKKGYQTSGAIIDLGERLPETDQPVIVTIKIIEGTLEKIEIILKEKNTSNSQQPIGETQRGRLANYIQPRLKVKVDQPLNINELLEALQLLQTDPLIAEISATLEAGTTTDKNILVVKYRPTNFLNPVINFDNSRPPSVGTFQRGITLTGNNLLGLGDIITTDYNNTNGSNSIDVSYILPANPNNGTIRFDYSWTDNKVIEPPFDDINKDGDSPDITSKSRDYQLTFRQPIIQNINNQQFTELSVGLTGSWRESKSYLLDFPFPLSSGADEDGVTHVFALRFFQEFTQQYPQQIIAFRSQFNFGIDAFNSTINEQILGVEPIPDSTFFYWQGQAQYIRFFGQDKLLLLRGNLQVANQPLLPMEQFATGGFGSVRGYRQDQLLTDNGLFLSADFQIPIIKIDNWNSVVQIIPFFDYGTTWNTGRSNPEIQTLSSIGLGLQWRIDDNFQARLDYGIPLVNVESRDRTLQEQGLYFSIQFNPF